MMNIVNNLSHQERNTNIEGRKKNMGLSKYYAKMGNTVGLTNTALKEGLRMRRIGQISDWDTTLELHLTWTHIHLEVTQNGTTIKMELNAKKCLELIESLMSGYKHIK